MTDSTPYGLWTMDYGVYGLESEMMKSIMNAGRGWTHDIIFVAGRLVW
jgi:hypothetical protein